jgi:hypothetical protein
MAVSVADVADAVRRFVEAETQLPRGRGGAAAALNNNTTTRAARCVPWPSASPPACV